jgi:hypothetical protein
MEVLIMVYGIDLFNKKRNVFIYFCLGHPLLKVTLIYFHIFMHAIKNSHLLEIKMLMHYSITHMLLIEINFNN